MQAQQLKLENGMRQLMQVFPRAKVKFAWKGVDSTMDLAEMKPDEVRSAAQRSAALSSACAAATHSCVVWGTAATSLLALGAHRCDVACRLWW